MDFLFEPVPATEAIAYIRGKAPLSRAQFDKMLPELRALAFTVSGINAADALQDLRDTVARLGEGVTFPRLQKEVAGKLARYLDTDSLQPLLIPESAEEAATRKAQLERRAGMLIRHHGNQAYAVTAFNDLEENGDIFPYWRYLTVGDGHVRDTHRSLDGVILPKGHEFWKTHFPPWEFGCRCQVVPVTEDEYREHQQLDAGRKLEDRVTLTDAQLEQLTKERVLLRNIAGTPTRMDLRAPREKTGEEHPYIFDPAMGLRPDLPSLKARYDNDTWAQFERFARGARLPEGGTVWGWLVRGGKPRGTPSTPAPAPQPQTPPAARPPRQRTRPTPARKQARPPRELTPPPQSPTPASPSDDMATVPYTTPPPPRTLGPAEPLTARPGTPAKKAAKKAARKRTSRPVNPDGDLATVPHTTPPPPRTLGPAEPLIIPPNLLPENFEPHINADDDAIVKLRAMLPGLQPGDVHRLGCCHPGTSILLHGDERKQKLLWQSAEGRADRVIYRMRDGSLVMDNEYFLLNEKAQGQGIRRFSEQVFTAQRLGIAKIETLAARGAKFNGYYTWPRFGYDGPLGDGQITQFRADFGVKVTHVSEIMGHSREAQQWWKKHGDSLTLEFDLTPGSKSMRTLEAYLQERGLANPNGGDSTTAPASISSLLMKHQDDIDPIHASDLDDIELAELAAAQAAQDDTERGDEITLDAEDEAALDRAWARQHARPEEQA